MKNNLFRTILFSLTALACHGLLADKVEPAKDAIAFRGNHKAFLDTNSTVEAKFACDDIGGELVVIGDAMENEFVRRIAKDRVIWLGGTDEFEEGTWTWDNGDAFKFKNWMKDNLPYPDTIFSFSTGRTENGRIPLISPEK